MLVDRTHGWAERIAVDLLVVVDQEINDCRLLTGRLPSQRMPQTQRADDNNVHGS
jgi:hypothetical protein